MKYTIKRVPGIVKRYGIFDEKDRMYPRTFLRYREAAKTLDIIVEVMSFFMVER